MMRPATGGRTIPWLFLALVCVLSFFTYVQGFSQVHAPIFDEHYYIPDAERYIHLIHFEKHNPPLGKLLIAAGEWMLHGTAGDDSLIGLEVAPDFPPMFDFTGYRLLPVLLAWLTAPVFFGLFLLLIRKPLFAFLCTFPYIFDNALIAHQRAAMLEGPLLFFCAVAFLLFVGMIRLHKHSYGWFIALGVALGLAASVKFTGLILLPLPFIAASVLCTRKNRILMAGVSTLSMLIVMAGVWQIHFTLGTHIDPRLPDNGYYLASPAYHRILETHTQWAPLSFPVMLRDALHFARAYSDAIPPLNDQTSVMGSPPYLWPIGGRSIRYIQAPDGAEVRTLALQINPVAWVSGIIGIIASLWMMAMMLRTTRWKNVCREHAVELTLLGLYIGYLGTMSAMRRVMFLYHFFIPLLCSLILFTLVMEHLRKTKGDTFTLIFLLLWMTALCAAYSWYAPLTYLQPLTTDQLQQRALLPLWRLP